MNETLVCNNIWNEGEEDSSQRIQNSTNEAQDYFKILEENDDVKTEIAQIEVENNKFIQRSEYNQQRIAEMVKELTDIKNKNNVNTQISPKFSENTQRIEMEDHSSYSRSEIGGLTKLTSDPTEGEIFSIGNKAKMRYQTFSTTQDDNCTLKDMDFQRLAKEMNIPNSSIISLETSNEGEKKPLEEQSIEGLIDELKQEYQLTNLDITHLKSDFENTLEKNLNSTTLENSFCMKTNKANMSQRIDKGTLKTNLMLKLMNKKMSKMANEQHSIVSSSVNKGKT
eukprot:CAMPEP_0205802984 /NCGR_PEP_ID=MMETSP0205-20121125/5482_1 /ASSEMBLY_ACC=CAM_ASM_000278 /TAXON_ID=36767 /ORGANISM="Euplotes focardii, Strain TN1" /LENGTH=281 /DNA_ID=CAMNT_0053070297 /DNA_START=232 /DNA_END=1074 /DNA_ORIENTATION=-